MAGRADSVKAYGLAELQKAARAADPMLARELRKRQKTIAEDIVDKATARGKARGGVTAKSTDALKAKAEQRAAKVLIDGQKFPYALGGEFGSIAHSQFEAWRGNQYTDPLGQNVGYFVHPTLRAERDSIIGQYEELVDDIVELLARGR